MTSDIEFTDPPKSFAGPDAGVLPWNYVEVAMPQMIGQGNGRARIVMVLPTSEQEARYAAIGADRLALPEATVAYIAGFDGLVIGADDGGPKVFLGPETDLKPRNPEDDSPAEPVKISAEPWSLITNRPFTHAVVVIDAGIAFWNARFREGGASRFRGVRYLDFDLPNIGQSNVLTDIGVESYCRLAEAEGSAAVIEKLGALYPNSVFGTAANPSVDGLWHGTAIADLAAGGSEGEAGTVAIFGLELPRAVIADYSGSLLTATVALILEAAIGMTEPFKELPLTIVMPLGFPAGPQDGSHPAALAIRLALAKSGRRNVTLVLPAGNQLQDRCHARLNGDSPASQVNWDLAPDDHSTNVVEMFGPVAREIGLSAAAPSQTSLVTARMPENSYCFVAREGEKIGVLLRGTDRFGRYHMGLALWQTAVSTTWDGVPFGRWTLAADEGMQLWLARDDRDPVADRGRPRRPSRFWDAAYTRYDASGALLQSDDPASAIRRTGTLSALATTLAAREGGPVRVVRAMERLGKGGPGSAGYSSRREDGDPVPNAALVDDGWPNRGKMVAANGGPRRVRISGTSAAAGLFARLLVQLPPTPDP